MRTMYDSTNAADIPADATMVAFYLDIGSSHPNPPKPNVTYVSIARNVNENAHVLDVETGDATPQQAPSWVLRERKLGYIPTVYMSAFLWPSVREQFTQQEVAEPQYMVAAYDNDPAIPAGAIAKQYINPPRSGGHYDISSVADYWPGVDHPEPVPAFNERGVMLAIRPDGSAADYFLVKPANSDFATGTINADGSQVKAYTPAPYANHPLSEINGMGWTNGALVVQVKGDDGVDYLAVYVNNEWQELVNAE